MNRGATVQETTCVCTSHAHAAAQLPGLSAQHCILHGSTEHQHRCRCNVLTAMILCARLRGSTPHPGMLSYNTSLPCIIATSLVSCTAMLKAYTNAAELVIMHALSVYGMCIKGSLTMPVNLVERPTVVHLAWSIGMASKSRRKVSPLMSSHAPCCRTRKPFADAGQLE